MMTPAFHSLLTSGGWRRPEERIWLNLEHQRSLLKKNAGSTHLMYWGFFFIPYRGLFPFNNKHDILYDLTSTQHDNKRYNGSKSGSLVISTLRTDTKNTDCLIWFARFQTFKSAHSSALTECGNGVQQIDNSVWYQAMIRCLTASCIWVF